MGIATEAESYALSQGGRYDPDMATVERASVEKVRPVLGKQVDKARESGVHTVMSKHGSDAAVIVPMDWYRAARRILGDPTDL